MLITIYGNKTKEKQKKISAILKDLKQKRPNAIFSHLDFLDLTPQKLDELINTTGGLFESKNITLLTNILQDTTIKKHFLKNLKKIQDSENAFILNEDEITTTDLKKIKSYSLKMFPFVAPIKKINIFLLSDLLQTKNKKQLWITYHQFLQNNLGSEDIFSNFFYSLKSLVLAEKFSLEESGLKPYPYQKASGNLKKWKTGEAEKKLYNLISYYVSARSDGLPLETALEKFILEL